MRKQLRFVHLLAHAATVVSVLLATLMVTPVVLAAGPPTVNGLFYGDGDSTKYTYYGTSPIGGATIWTYADASAQKLYVALVVDGRFNDNAFDMKLHPGDPSAYMQSAGWTSNGANARPAVHLMNSEYAEFTATICNTDYTWRQGYAAEGDKTNAEDYDNMAQDWHSDMDSPKSNGTPPTGYASSSSIVWNMNNYAHNLAIGHPTYDMNVNCAPGDTCNSKWWKSPFDPAHPDDITHTGGFPATFMTGDPITFSTQYQWEWAMVYEWSATLPDGCDYTVASPEAHHSPYKTLAPTAVTISAVTGDSGTSALLLFAAIVATSVAVAVPRKSEKE